MNESPLSTPLSETSCSPPRMLLNDKGQLAMRLRSELLELGLEKHVLDLELLGYTVIENAIALDVVDELRASIMAAAEEDRRRGRAWLNQPHTQMVFELLLRGPAFERAILEPRQLALVSYLLGMNFQVSAMSANIVSEGAMPQALHSDSSFIPNPLPTYALIANACWCLDDFTEAGGATLVVPGSHRLHSHPAMDALEGAIPVECPRGSIFVQNGNVWHHSGRRRLPGARVAMFNYFSRMYLRPLEDYYSKLPEEAFARNPPRLRTLVGHGNPMASPDRYGPRFDQFVPRIFDMQHPYG
jgi:phytanoyl-CoA dioxygenase PhyH